MTPPNANARTGHETTELSFTLAHVDARVAVTGPRGLDALGGYYQALPPALGCDVDLKITRTENFSTNRTRGPEYPAFAVEKTPQGLRVDRFDAAGTLEFAADRNGLNPVALVRGNFTVGPSPNSVEAAIRIALSVALPRVGSLIMHSSAVADSRGAHLFAGVSGAGKSTIAALLAQTTGVEKISDELLVLTRRDGRWGVVSAPFIGCGGLPHGQFVPLLGVYFLAQAAHDAIIPVSPGGATAELLRHVLVYARDVDTAGSVLGAAAELCAEIPCSTLQFCLTGDLPATLGLVL